MKIKFQNTNIESNKKTKQSKKSFWEKDILVLGNTFSTKGKEEFYSELSILLKSGVNLKTALDLLSDSQTKKREREIIFNITSNILDGTSLSQVLRQDKSFTVYEYQAITIGEQTGKLSEVMEDLRDYFRRKNALKRQLVSSLSYPILVLVLAVAVVIFMLNIVVPMFTDIFKRNDAELPWLTRQVVNTSNFISENGWILLGLLVLIIVVVKSISKTEWYYRVIGKTQLRIPVFGNYIKKVYLLQFTQAMTLLSNAKIPMINGIKLVKEMIKFYPLESSLNGIEKDILLGEKINVSFAKHSLYDKKMVAMLKVAEETNQTEYIFQKLYDQYNAELEYKGKIISNVLNFLLTFFIAIVVGVILISMYLPMFKLSSVMG